MKQPPKNTLRASDFAELFRTLKGKIELGKGCSEVKTQGGPELS